MAVTPLRNEAEERVSQFYNSVGWTVEDDVTEDAKLWEDLRPNAADYVRQCRLRVLRHIPSTGDTLLDMASGPVQYPEYVAYSKNYRQRYCVDLSAEALAQARRKLGDRGVYLAGSFFDLVLDENFFDCSISLHTIYHIDAARQEEAVRKLLRVTKPGGPVIIVYSNPQSLMPRLRAWRPFRALKRIWGWFRKPSPPSAPPDASAYLYFHPLPLGWWQRFTDVASVRVYPWRTFEATTQKALMPDNRFGKWLLQVLFALEDKLPGLFVKIGQYPMIVLTKR